MCDWLDECIRNVCYYMGNIVYILFIVCLSRPQRRVNIMVKGSVNVAVVHLIGVVIL